MQFEQRHIEAHDAGTSLFSGTTSIHGMGFMRTSIITLMSDTDSSIYLPRGIRPV